MPAQDNWGLGPIGGNGLGKTTIAFGSLLNAMVPPRQKCFTRIMSLVYTAAGTAHTITCMIPIGRTTFSADAAASQAVVNLTADPGVSGNLLAGGDYLAWENTDGTFSFDFIASLATLAATMTSVLPKAVSAGGKVWNFGVIGDTHPVTGNAHVTFRGVASVTSTYSDTTVGVLCTYAPYDPIIIQSNNATATGIIESVAYMHTQR